MIDNIAYVSYTQIAGKLPIFKGDILYVVSNILDIAKASRNNNENFECEGFIHSLQDAVGESGTLLFPTFNWDFCKGIAFDYFKTRGKVGALGNAALKMIGFKRTQHPIYSFAVWGKAQNDLIILENKSGFGAGSPFAYMHQNKAKALVIGLTATIGNTFEHYTEEMVRVNFRYDKDFSALYTDEKRNSEVRTYSMYVRDMEINPLHTSFAVIDDVMSALGICKDFTINGVHFHVVELSGMFEVVSLELRYNNAKNLYSFERRR
jgi:aminoglycoside 3-N-acetyltransferase